MCGPFIEVCLGAAGAGFVISAGASIAEVSIECFDGGPARPCASGIAAVILEDAAIPALGRTAGEAGVRGARAVANYASNVGSFVSSFF